MKTLLTILFFCSALFSSAQIQQVPTIRLLGVENPTVCPGDSITILYKMELGDWQQVNLTGTNLNQIWQVNPTVFAAQSSTVINGVVVHSIRLAILPGMTLGQGLLYVPNFPEVFTIYFDCNETGISSAVMPDIPAQYYNLDGAPCNKTTGALLIERVGYKVRKVVFMPD